jgi:hypothetical protein
MLTEDNLRIYGGDPDRNELAGAANLSRNSVGTMLQRRATRGLVKVGNGTMVLAPAALRAFVDHG